LPIVDGVNGCCALLVIQLRSKYICSFRSFVHSSIHPQSSVQTCNEREQMSKEKEGSSDRRNRHAQNRRKRQYAGDGYSKKFLKFNSPCTSFMVYVEYFL
jgi:hypothetical protein